MEQRTSLTEIIEYINPGDLNYQEWINVGMALIFLERRKGYPGRQKRPHNQRTAVWMDSVPEHDRV